MAAPAFTGIDLIVPDVPAATRMLVDGFGAGAVVEEAEFAEVDLGGLTVMLSRTAMVPVEPARGVILHLQVEDPEQAAERAVAHGASVLKPLTTTGWGTRSVLASGPADAVIDLFCPALLDAA